MFQITLRKLSLTIEGCPESGIEAVEFRRTNNIPAAPTNRIEVEGSVVSEVVTRAHAPILGQSADLYIVETNYSSGNCPSITHGLITSDHDHVIPPELASALTREPLSDTAVDALIRNLLATLPAVIEARNRQEVKEQAEKDARKAKQAQAEADRVAAYEKESSEKIAKLSRLMTEDEKFLAGRGRLDMDDVISRLTTDVLGWLDDAMAQCPKPQPFTGDLACYSTHEARYARSTWNADWVPTVKFIENVTKHPVVSVCVDCIIFNTHVTVPWQDEPLPIHVQIDKPESEE